jgi:parvulin-like peptidyl-prolyl isomerase
MTLKVNGKSIPEAAILNELKRLLEFYSQHLSRAELGQHADELVVKAREHAVGTQLLIDEVKRRHIEIPDADVDKSIRDMTQRVGGEDKLVGLLAKQGLTVEQFRASVRAGKQLDQLVSRVTSGVPDCTDEELQKYYDEHAERYATPDQVQVRHILIKPASDREPDKATTRSLLLSLRHKAMEGEDFSGLAAEHSECPSGKEAGGDLGWIVRGTTLPEFDNIIFGMDIGEISDVFETPAGLHIVEKMDETVGEPMTFHEVKERINDLLMHERKGKALSDYVEKLRGQAVIEDMAEGSPDIWERVFDSFLDGQKPS